MSKVLKGRIVNAHGKTVTNLSGKKFDFAVYERSDTAKAFIGYCGSRGKVSGAIPEGGRLELTLDSGTTISGKFETGRDGKRHIVGVTVNR